MYSLVKPFMYSLVQPIISGLVQPLMYSLFHRERFLVNFARTETYKKSAIPVLQRLNEYYMNIPEAEDGR